MQHRFLRLGLAQVWALVSVLVLVLALVAVLVLVLVAVLALVLVLVSELVSELVLVSVLVSELVLVSEPQMGAVARHPAQAATQVRARCKRRRGALADPVDRPPSAAWVLVVQATRHGRGCKPEIPALTPPVPTAPPAH